MNLKAYPNRWGPGKIHEEEPGTPMHAMCTGKHIHAEYTKEEVTCKKCLKLRTGGF